MIQFRVGQQFRAVRDIPLVGNVFVKVLSSSTPIKLAKGTHAEIVEIAVDAITVNCKAGVGNGPSAWGLKLRVAKVQWGSNFGVA